jgi:Tc toxin complex TcA C-terminal TcB-binding domain
MNPPTFQSSARFHEAADLSLIAQPQFRQFWPIEEHVYTFEAFFHAFVGALITQLNEATGDPIAALCDPKFLAGLQNDCFGDGSGYQVENDVAVNSCREQIDLEHQLPYANYNWELLYHIPVAVAVHLSQNQRFAEAQKWFHYVFDPTSKDLDVPAPTRFWKFLHFRDQPPTLDLGTLLRLLSDGAASDAGQVAQKQDILTSYAASCAKPFRPFAVARPRTVAFQYYVVMKYLDNLIAWGDSLFSQMTIETVNEATLCYALAANLLGQRPQKMPPVGASSARSYNDLKKAGLDKLGDALVKLEGQFPFNITTSAPAGDGSESSPVFGMGRSLYFCIPPNSKLLGYWDIVDDRLTKIRNCENIRGQVQLMPLFDPPIDPGMLVKAAAAGLDIGSVVSGLNQPVSPIRTPLLIQKAGELCAEVRSLGAGLLSAVEKADAEHLAQLRQNHEITLHQMTQNVRYLQWQQAKAATEALLRSRASALERYTFYLRLLGLQPDATNAPATFTVDHGQELTEDNFDDAYQDLVTKYDLPIPMQAYPPLQLTDSSSPSAQSGASGAGRLYLNTNEDDELNTHMPAARDARIAANISNTLAGVLAPIPTVEAHLAFWGLGGHSKLFSGGILSAMAKSAADIAQVIAGWEQDQGAMAARKAGYQRRANDWLLQANLAARELSQLGRQLLASLITEQAAHHEYASAKAQVGQSQEVLDFLQTKFTSEELYGWMQGQLSNLYYQYYRFALDTARKAEQTMKWELMRPELDAATYIQPNYWDSGHQGLLAGEALHLDLKRMELDYHNYNLRELELTRHVSLRQLDPIALLSLKITGSCTVTIPEWLYDRDCPGHYMRRIKTVAVSVPSVVGPYTGVNCTLTLQRSSVRVSPQKGNGYQRDPANTDPRFIDYTGSIQSIVTSGAVADSGMFETNLRDERFLPFEGAGAISTWTLSLPAIRSFDYATISDVILHMRYTARDGGQALGSEALTTLKELPPTSGTTADAAPSLGLLLSLRHDFPTQWYAFTSGNADFTATLTMDYFPYFVQDTTLAVEAMTLYTDSGHEALTVPANMSAELKSNKSTNLTFPEDQNILTRDPTKEVYVVIAYNARRT